MTEAPPPKGVSVDYCLECAEKHLRTAKVLLREAIQRAQKHGTKHPAVLEKIRDVVTELTGCEDDTDTTLDNKKVRKLNITCRDLRKLIWNKKLSFGKATLQDLQQLYKQISQLADYIYETETSKDYEPLIEQAINEVPRIMPEEKQTLEKLRQEQLQTQDKAIEIAQQKQQEELQIKEAEKQLNQPPKPKKTLKQIIKEASKITPEEEQEALYRDMIKKYASLTV